MPPKFDLGKVTVKEEAAYALIVSGQDASFFLEKHAGGDWGDGDPAQNEKGLREGSMVLSKYRSLRGHDIFVVTFPDRRETHLFCPPNGVIGYVPLPDLAVWGENEGEIMKHQPGNGSGRFDISQVDMGGWVRVFPANRANAPDDVHVFLSQSLADWFRQRPQLGLRAVVPITKSGDTVELHAWYECHVFPASPEAPQPLV